MIRAFAESTVVCNALPLPCVGSAKARVAAGALAAYVSTEAPVYALKELRVGPLAALMLMHNLLAEHATIESALDEFQRKTSFTPRKWGVSSRAIIASLLQVIHQLRARTAEELLREDEPDVKTALEDVFCQKILQAWQRRHEIVDRYTHPLSCFVDGELELTDRLLRLPTEREDCVKGAPCGAAAELRRMPKEVRALLRALRPAKGEKGQTSTGRQALKEVLVHDAKSFPRNHCRALGDAYHCIVAPADRDLLTTNCADFKPMARVLNKKLRCL